MSDVQFLFAILGGLYAWECACWINRGGFFQQLDWRFGGSSIPTMLGNQRGGFVLAAPIPPLGAVLTANQFPFSLSPDGVLVFVSPNVNPGWRPTQSGRFLTGRKLGTCGLKGKIPAAKEKSFPPPPSRAPIIFSNRWLRFPNSPANIVRSPSKSFARRTRYRNRSKPYTKISINKSARFDFWPMRSLFLVFVIAPLLIGFIGLKLVWLGLLVALLGLSITTATLFCRLHRKFYPAASDERFTQTLILAMALATTMRAHDIASRPLLENFHPLAVAHHLWMRILFAGLPGTCCWIFATGAAAFPSASPQTIATELFYRRLLLRLPRLGWPKESFQPPNFAARQHQRMKPATLSVPVAKRSLLQQQANVPIVVDWPWWRSENPVEPTPTSD